MEIRLGTITFSIIKSRWEEDFIGSCEYNIDIKVIKKYYKYTGVIPYTDFIDIQKQEIFLKQGSLNNADLFICILSFINYYKIKCEIVVVTNHPFWVIHDYFHSLKDVTGFTDVYVNANIEKERIIETLDYMKENNIEIPNEFYFEQLSEDYKNRFKVPLKLNIENYIKIEDYE